jgi:hypothetical protein
MDEREFTREINSAWTLLKDTLSIGRTIISGRSLEVDAAFRDASLDQDSSYEQIFRTGLQRSNYNILLSDYAYFQFRRTDDHSWRLGYYPNPWLSGASQAERDLEHWEMLEDAGGLTYEETSELIAAMPLRGTIPPIRFEYALAQYKELVHPAAHFHIGLHSENRWPSAISIGPKAFVMTVAKLYYIQAWEKCSIPHGAAIANCIEEQLLAVLGNVRFVHSFSDRENRSFHFGKHTVKARAKKPPTPPRSRTRR